MNRRGRLIAVIEHLTRTALHSALGVALLLAIDEAHRQQ